MEEMKKSEALGTVRNLGWVLHRLFRGQYRNQQWIRHYFFLRGLKSLKNYREVRIIISSVIYYYCILEHYFYFSGRDVSERVNFDLFGQEQFSNEACLGIDFHIHWHNSSPSDSMIFAHTFEREVSVSRKPNLPPSKSTFTTCRVCGFKSTDRAYEISFCKEMLLTLAKIPFFLGVHTPHFPSCVLLFSFVCKSKISWILISNFTEIWA